MQHSDEFMLDRLTRIAELKQKKRISATLSDKFLYDSLLFENYYTISADSALHYADECIAIALEVGDSSRVTHGLINRASVLSATGLLKGALDVMEKIDPINFTRDELVDYYGQMIYLYSHLGNYAEGSDNDYYVIERLYKDSIMNVIEPSHPEYLWYKGWDVLGTDRDDSTVINALIESLETSDLQERIDAKNAYILSRLFKERGDKDNYEKYLALAAIIDVKIANSEIASLEDLAALMFDNGKGDVDRAYSYIDYSLAKAMDYPNRSKAFGISKTLEKISTAYQERIRSHQRHTNLFLILVCILAGILVLAVVAIILQNKKLKRQREDVNKANYELNEKIKALSMADSKLNEMNHLLKNLNSDLKIKNAELNEANIVKEEYIGYVFNLCSTYIDKIEDLKKNIYLKAVKKQLKDIESLTSNIDMKGELKEFYHSFDTIFLTLYPNFVSDFNSLLQPDKQIVLKEGELLNMELRIYALIRLGITDSVKIADFLHCASQTVYNYRLRSRSRSLYDKGEFMSKLKSIGNFLGND